MRRAVVVVALAWGALACAQDADPVGDRARQVAKLIAKDPDVKELGDALARSFLQAMPAERVAAVVADVFRKGGAVTEVTKLSGEGWSGKYEFVQAKGTRLEVTLAVESKPPHRITGLWFKPRPAPARSFGEIAAEVKRLPGRVSFAVARLASDSVATLAAHDADVPVAIGSAFKLYVLGALADEVARGRRAWADTTPLRADRRSLPSGLLHTWPVGGPVTLHTLAALMISQSDNTATDHLLLELGRERVERKLEEMGNATPARTLPFLTTAELFKLKWGTPDLSGRYLAAALEEKRRLLANDVAAVPLPGIGGIASDEPRLTAELEWFASANDLVRAMDWLRRAPREAREVLAINGGGLDAKPWRYVGFKGGSEPGVLQLTWLLERPDGAWFVVTGGWNDPDVDTHRFVGLLAKAADLASRATEKKPY